MINKKFVPSIILTISISFVLITVVSFNSFSKINTNAKKTSSESIKKNIANKKQPIVVIDAGHGGYDPGSTGPRGTKEKDNCLKVALKVGSILAQHNIHVVYTRTTDVITWASNQKENLKYRVKITNAANADIFISIHNNFSDYIAARGTETYYFDGNNKSRVLANDIQKNIVSAVNTRNRGVKSTTTYYVLKKVNTISVLVELGFISNPDEEVLLNNASEQDKFAKGIAEGAIVYLANR